VSWGSLSRRVLLAGLIGPLLACGAEIGVLDIRVPPSLPPALLEDVVFEGWAGDEREVEVRARRARVDMAERVVHLEGVRIEFRDAERGPVEIRAQRGTLDLEADDFVLEGRVEGRIGADERFETSELRYDAARERVWTDQPVRVTRPSLRLEGDGLEIDVPARRLTIRGNVRTTLAGQG
jgi:LPS export ABC transporter protein LptC